MFPVPSNLITRLNFRTLAITNHKYTDLIRAEYNFCKKNEAKIIKHAKKTYKDGCNRSLYIAQYINDFKELEKHYIEYDPDIVYEVQVKGS